MNDSLSDSERRLIRKLHESEYFLEHVSNNTPDIIYVLDIRNNKYTYTNKRVQDVMGPDNILMDKIHPQDHDRRKLHMKMCVALKRIKPRILI